MDEDFVPSVKDVWALIAKKINGHGYSFTYCQVEKNIQVDENANITEENILNNTSSSLTS
ncbi:unnamed protein product [Ceratitis capitata]|uniref:(Mediterranean fruit fly) hypothetical protein n=1 Tax=Ceratitis capitata TaxID=7213 RepID=A0A811UI06_CERCA|nr:unnamed protein product [Ceratitis capitata]